MIRIQLQKLWLLPGKLGRGRQYLFTRYEVSPRIRNRTVELDTRSETRLLCDGLCTLSAESYWLPAAVSANHVRLEATATGPTKIYN